MPFDTSRLEPVETATKFDTSRLEPVQRFDVSRLEPVDQGGFVDNAKNLVTTGLTALNRGMITGEQAVIGQRIRGLTKAEEQARVRQADEANPTLRDVPVQQNLPATLDTGSYAEADRRRLAEAKPYDTTVKGRDPEEYAARKRANLADLARREVESKKFPAPKIVEEYYKTKSLGEAWEVFKKAPATMIVNVGMESLPASLASAGAFAAGNVVGGPSTGMALAGSISAGTDYAMTILGAMREEGIDFTDAAAVEAAFKNKEMMDRIEKRAMLHAGPVGVMDAVSMGVAGKVLAPKGLIGHPVLRELANIFPQIGVQAAAGMAGEAGGQLASGQPLNAPEILAEGFGEAVSTPVDVAAASFARGERPIGDFERVLREIDGKPAPTAAGGLPTPEGLVPAQDVPPPPPAPVSSPEPQSGYEGLYGGSEAADEAAYAKLSPELKTRVDALREIAISEENSSDYGSTPKSQAARAEIKAILSAPPTATSTVLDEISKREGGKKSPLGKGLSEITAGQKGGQAAVDRVAGLSAPLSPDEEVRAAEQGLAATGRKNPALVRTLIGIPVGEPVKITTPDSSAEIEARPTVIELESLRPATGKLQPRDRSRVEMVQEAKERAVRLDPARLMPDRVSDAGAPIVSPDGTVISGNGRMLSIAEVYSNPALKAQANAYKAALPAEAQGMKKPVLVMQSQLSGLDAERFAQQSNRPRIATMSATEQANTDAAVMGDILDLYQGGDFESAPNAPFLKAFATNVVASSERNSFSKDGQLSAEGMRRMQGAILARAYGESDLLSRMLESTDDNVRAIVGALQDAAPQMAALRKAVQAGQVMEGLDPLADISDAVKLISDMRKKRLSPAKFFRQMDAFTEINPDVAGWVLSLYNPADPKTGVEAGEHALSRSQMAAVFRAFANEAMQHKTGGFFDDETTRADILSAVGRNAAQGAALAEAPNSGPSDGSGRTQGGQAASGSRGPQAALGYEKAPTQAGAEQSQVEPRGRREAYKRLKSGADYAVPPATVYAVLDALRSDWRIVPSGTRVGIVEAIEPYVDPTAKVGEEGVKVTLRQPNGKTTHRYYLRSFILRANAFFDPEVNALIFVRLGEVPRVGKEAAAFSKSLRGELRHELLHLLRANEIISGAQWDALVSHARRLQVLRFSQRSFALMTGKPVDETTSNSTLQTLYTNHYRKNGKTDKEIQAGLEEESVTHMLELAYHGKLNPREIDPIQSFIDQMELGMYGRGAQTVGTEVMASLQVQDDLSPTSAPSLDPTPFQEPEFVLDFDAVRSKVPTGVRKVGDYGLVAIPSGPNYLNYYLLKKGLTSPWDKRGGLAAGVLGEFRVKPGQNGGVEVTNARLDENHQRKGTGTKVYDIIEKDFAPVPLMPSPWNQLSEAAVGFWNKRAPDKLVYQRRVAVEREGDMYPDRKISSSRLLASLSPTSAPSLDPDDAGRLRKARDSALEFLQDAQVRVRRLVERASEPLPDEADPYMAMTLYHGRLGGRAEEAVAKAEEILRGANAIAKATSSPLENVKRLIDLYLVAKHAPERNAVHGDGSAGLTNAEATAALARVSALPQGAEIIRVANLVLDMNRRTLQTLLDGKVISQETYDLLSTTYANHVPLNRILPEGDEEIGAILAGGGFDVRGTGLQRARGSKLPIAPILENVLLNHQQAILRAEKNTVDLATLAFVRRFEDDLKGQITILGGAKPARTIDAAERGIRDQINALKKMLPKDDRPHHMERMPSKSINDPRVLELREDGERVLIRFRDPKLAAAFKATNRDTMPKLLYPAMLYTRVMSQLATRFNPEFAPPNKIRDIQETAIYIAAQKELGAKGAGRFLLRELKGENYKAILDWMMGRDTPGARLYQEMIDEGGTTGGLALSSRDRVQESLAEIEKVLTANPGNIRKALKTVAKGFDHLNKVFEDSTRLSAYRMAKARGLSNKRAAVHAKEASINFNRMGTAGPVVNGLWMFSNASIQGTTKMIRAMRNPKVATTVVLGMAAAVAAVGQWNDGWDEKWREKVTKWDRLNSLIVVLPGARDATEWERGIDYIVVPVSWGLKPFLNLTNYAYDAAEGIDWDWGDFLHDMTVSTLEAFNPVGGTNLVSALMPTILDTPSEIWSNTSWSGSKIKPDPQRDVPEDVRYFPSLADKASGRAAIATTEALVDSTGIAISPADINYVFEQLIGGTGRAIGKAASTSVAVIEGKPLPLDEFPFISRFYRQRTADEITGKNELGAETREVRKLVEGQGRERVRRKYQLEGIFEEIKTLPKDQIKKRIAEEVKKDPAALDVFKGLLEAEAKGLTGLDKQINLLGVENGERARYYFDRLREASPEERRSIVEDGVKKGLISRGVIEQIGTLNQLERLSPEQRKKVRDLATESGLRLPPE